MDFLLGIAGTVVVVGYAVVLLIIMLLPNVSAAFRGETAIGGSLERLDDDFYDEGYERRRRDDVER